ncbi:MAG: 4Fe-4S binding protein [Planctomycetaceae bacterium]|jgi:polyferredoxin|nr:4Fe-4S binding protein [Planctomycetaceae bacterium]
MKHFFENLLLTANDQLSKLIPFWRVVVYFFLFFLSGVFADNANAVPRNPPPVFETEYTLPVTETPEPFFPPVPEKLSAVGIYTFFLILAGLAAFYWRSRKILFFLAVGSVILLGFAMQGCPCPVGMFQNIVDAFVQPFPFIPYTVLILFVLPLFAALIFGRIFCSSVCPFGAVQELTALKNVRIPEGLEQVLGLFRFFWLGLGVFFVVTGLGYFVCRFDPYVGFFRFGGIYPIMIFSSVLLLLGLFIGRPFCRFFCPYGALLGLCGSVSAKKVSVTPGECTKCRLCEEICPYNAILKPTAIPTNRERQQGPKRVLTAIVIFPVFILFFAWVGYQISPKFASWHVDVRRAELLYAEEQKLVDAFGTFPETRALLQTDQPYEEVYRLALERFQRFRHAGFWLGIWVGAVIGAKLISLTLRRRRTEYEVDPARCVACGRCFWYCPNQKEHRMLLEIEKE